MTTTTTPTGLPTLPLELLHLITAPENLPLSSLSALTRTSRTLHHFLTRDLLSRGLNSAPSELNLSGRRHQDTLLHWSVRQRQTRLFKTLLAMIEAEEGERMGGKEGRKRVVERVFKGNKRRETVMHVAAEVDRDGAVEEVSMLLGLLPECKLWTPPPRPPELRRRRAKSLDGSFSYRREAPEEEIYEEDTVGDEEKHQPPCAPDPICTPDCDFETALHLAVKSRSPRIAQLLIRSGACTDHRGSWEYLPELTAAANGDLEILRLLRGEQRRRRALGKEGNPMLHGRLTALHVAAAYAQIEVMRWLVEEEGEDVEAETYRGVRPMGYAAVAIKRAHGSLGWKPNPRREDAARTLERLGAKRLTGAKVEEKDWSTTESDFLGFVKEPEADAEDMERKRLEEQEKRIEEERLNMLRNMERNMCGKRRRGAERFWRELD